MLSGLTFSQYDYDLVIVGAGAAGLFCSAMIAELFPKGLRVLLIEKTATIGNKLLLSGNGQCNYTHAGDMKDFSGHYGENYGFLKPALHSLSNTMLMKFFEELGVKSLTRDDLKVFPASLKAEEIRDALSRHSGKYPVEIKTSHELTDITYSEDGMVLAVNNSLIKAKYLILCTGGASYPETGSAGDIARLLKGVKIKSFKPALSVPVLKLQAHSNANISELAGISYHKATVSVWRLDKKLFDKTGSLLFTHKGLSGPLILDNSRYFKQGDKIVLYLTEYTDLNEFERHFIALMGKHPKRITRNIVSMLKIPESIIEFLALPIEEGLLDTKAAELSKQGRKSIVKAFFSMEFSVKSLGNILHAMCSNGGVDLSEINRSTMSLKKYPNIFVAGECIDVDGDTGGYNIHAAFATANIIVRHLSNIFSTKE